MSTDLPPRASKLIEKLRVTPFHSWDILEIESIGAVRKFAMEELGRRLLPYLMGIMSITEGFDVQYDVEKFRLLMDTMKGPFAEELSRSEVPVEVQNEILKMIALISKIPSKELYVGPRTQLAIRSLIGLVKGQYDFLRALGVEFEPSIKKAAEDPQEAFAGDRAQIP